MPIRNKNLSRDARKEVWTHHIRPLTADLQSGCLVEMENDIRILRVDIVFAEASGANEDEIVEVGTVADDDVYVSYTVADNQAIGTKVAATLLSTAVLPAGTPLIVKKSAAGTDTSSTALLAVNITYERIDRTV